MDDYTEFSGDPELQSGHYVALKFDFTEGATVTIQLLGGAVVRDPVALDSDKNAVLRITNPMKQTLKVTATLSGHQDLVKIYTFKGIKFE